MAEAGASEDQVAQFSLITGIDTDQARFFVESAGGDLQTALSTFYETVGSTNLPAPTPQGALSPDAQSSGRTGPQTLSGAPADELPAEWRRTAPSVNPPRRSTGPKTRGITSFGDLTGSGALSHPTRRGVSTLKDIASASSPAGGDMSEDDEEEERDGGPDLYAGGGKSGLNVQDPAQQNGGKAAGIVADILKKAKEAGAAAVSSASAPQPSKSSSIFKGSAHTLGSDEVPSRVVRPAAPASTRPPGAFPTALAVPGHFGPEFEENDEEGDSAEEVEKHLTFWKDGFSIEDGPLLAYEDPKNKQILDAINSGRAPLDLLGVRLNQRVTMRVEKRLSENYTPPPKPPIKPFEGSGNRLGSPLPVPALAGSSSQTEGRAAVPEAQPLGQAPIFEVDNALPVTSVRIRLVDGSRMVTRLNHTHTVGDIRRLITASNPNLASRPYILQTTFPSRDLVDDNQTIQDAGVLNANVVQRFA